MCVSYARLRTMYVLGLWVNRFAYINWIPRDSMYSVCLIRKTPAFFLLVADDIHFQFSQWLRLWYFTEDISENENENIYTEASSDNYHQTQKAMQSLRMRVTKGQPFSCGNGKQKSTFHFQNPFAYRTRKQIFAKIRLRAGPENGFWRKFRFHTFVWQQLRKHI